MYVAVPVTRMGVSGIKLYSLRCYLVPIVIAYVFWHRRKEEVSQDVYESKISRFHRTLEDSHLLGFKGAAVARIDCAPWLNENSEAYEDWYLLDGSEVLDKLNDVAVTGGRRESHDEVAHLATDFRGGLYQLKMGPFAAVLGSYAMWLSKPGDSVCLSLRWSQWSTAPRRLPLTQAAES